MKFIEYMMAGPDVGPYLEAARAVLAYAKAPKVADWRRMFLFLLNADARFMRRDYARDRVTYTPLVASRIRIVVLHKEVGTEVIGKDGVWRQGERADFIPAALELLGRLALDTRLDEGQRAGLAALVAKATGKRERVQARAGSKRERAFLRLAALVLIDAEHRDVAKAVAFANAPLPIDLLQVLEDKAAERGWGDRLPDFAALGLGVDRPPLVSTFAWPELKAIPRVDQDYTWRDGATQVRFDVGRYAHQVRLDGGGWVAMAYERMPGAHRIAIVHGYVNLDQPAEVDLFRRSAQGVRPPGDLEVPLRLSMTGIAGTPASTRALVENAGFRINDEIREQTQMPGRSARVVAYGVFWP